MPKADTIIDYQGPVTHETIETLLNELRAAREFTELKKPARKRLYGTFVELIDNIFKYADNRTAHLRSKKKAPAISIKKRGKKYIVKAGNMVLNENIGNLAFNLDRINQLDKEALKTLYEETINKESSEKDTGAGLGLITMALRTEYAVKYKFTSIDKDYSFFDIQITINE